MEYVETGLNLPESKEWFYEYVNDAHERIVFLSSESMREQLNSIGIPYVDVMHNVFAQKSKNDSKKTGDRFVQDLFQRRNLIVHQNDRSHESATKNKVDKEYVVYLIETINKIVNEIVSIASMN